MYQSERIVSKREQQLLICFLIDAVFQDTENLFLRMPRNNPLSFQRYLRHHDPGGGLENHPLSQLMKRYYRDNRCLDFHLLAMSCANGKKKREVTFLPVISRFSATVRTSLNRYIFLPFNPSLAYSVGDFPVYFLNTRLK